MIDTSIYANLKPVEMPSIADAYQKAMTLRQLALQNDKLEQDQTDRIALRKVIDKNTGADGRITGQGLSALASIDPEKAAKYQEYYGKIDKDASDVKAKNIETYEKTRTNLGHVLESLNSMDDSKFNVFYPMARADAIKNGLGTEKEIPLDPKEGRLYVKQISDLYHGTKDYQDRQKTAAEIKKYEAETRKLNSEAAEGKTPTQNQFTAAGFAKRAQQAEDIFSDLSNKGFDPTSAKNIYQQSLPSFLEPIKSDDVKQLEQAQRNFVNAVLRRESGSAISASEFDSAKKQYFPQIGDSPEVLNQKKINREIVKAALFAEGGNANKRLAANLNEDISKASPSFKSNDVSGLGMSEANAAPVKTKPDYKELSDGRRFVKVKGGWEQVK